MKQYLIAPSILSADFARLGEDTAKALAAVRMSCNFSTLWTTTTCQPDDWAPMVLKSLRNYGITALIDVHLMVKPVDRIIPDFCRSRRQHYHLPSGSLRTRRSQPAAYQRARL
ncbi:hypothetical protein MJ575_27290 [Klebsiella pneumoniae]|nr:hypothetical protein MJ575_27290 [Klebsiella pneumoniae]